MSEIAEKAKAKFVAEIDEEELTVRMMEAFMKLKRPPGATAREALSGSEDAESVASFRRAARAAMMFWKECIDRGSKTN